MISTFKVGKEIWFTLKRIDRGNSETNEHYVYSDVITKKTAECNAFRGIRNQRRGASGM